MSKRVNGAQRLLDALPDPQTALLLLRNSAAYCKIVYTRVTLPALLGGSLETFDGRMRQCPEAFCTGPLTAEA